MTITSSRENLPSLPDPSQQALSSGTNQPRTLPDHTAKRRAAKAFVPEKASKTWAWFLNIASLANREFKSRRYVKPSLTRRLALWRQGFLSESGVLYDLAGAEREKDYLSDYARYQRTAGINRPYDVIMHDKLLFWGFMRNFTDHVAPAYGLIRQGCYVGLHDQGIMPITAGLRQASDAPLILKPCTGSGGRSVVFYEHDYQGHRVNGAPIDDEQLAHLLQGEPYLVCPIVRQAAYARTIFPSVTNTIRVLTMYDGDAGEAFIAAAVHRFGARSDVNVDAWNTGGLSAAIDLATGRISRGVGFPVAGRIPSHTHHPITGVPIEGVTIANWQALRRGITELASKLPFLPYVGWDIIATDDGYVIIEGNNRSDVNLLQIHGPLLANERVRRFYRRHRVV